MAKISYVAAFALILGLTAVAPSYCEKAPSDEDLRVFEGRVVSVDVEASSIAVSGSMDITFYISPDTQLRRDIFGIKLSDIDKGDYVTVEYYRSGYKSRVPHKVIKVTVEYRDKP